VPFALLLVFFFSSRRRHTIFSRDWSSDVCSSDLGKGQVPAMLLSRNQEARLLKGAALHIHLDHAGHLVLFPPAAGDIEFPKLPRSEERRVGKESGSPSTH